MKKVLSFSLAGLFALFLLGTAVAEEPKEIPFDVKYATAVAAVEIMHTPDPSMATVSEQAAKVLGSDPFKYSGFALGATILKKYEPGSTGESSRKLTSVLQFMDKYRRTALQFVVLDYQIEKDNLVLNQADRWAIAPTDPFVEILFVPTEKMKQVGQGIYSSWEALYEFASTNAVKTPRTEKDAFYGFVFCMDRIAPDAKFYTVVSRDKRQKRKDKSIAKGTVLDYSGWKVGIVAGKFQLGNPAKKFYLNVFYNPKSGTPKKFRETKRIAQFYSGDQSVTLTAPPRQAAKASPATQQPAPPAPKPAPAPVQAPKQAPPKPVAPPAPVKVAPAPAPAPKPAPVPQQVAPAPKQAAPAPAAPAEGPLARGLSFLNPVFPEDVTLIQERLKALGFYRGPIDQTFGPQTKRALDNFAVKHGFHKGQWSLGLQKALFTGSGQ